MSYESLYSLEKSVVFRETFNNSYSVARNGGNISATGTLFQNGIIKFNAYLSNITYKGVLRKTASYRIRFRVNSLNGGGFSSIVSLSGPLISSSPGQGLFLQTFTTNIYMTSTLNSLYLNGKFLTSVGNTNFPVTIGSWNEVVILNVNGYVIGNPIIGYGNNWTSKNLDVELFEIYNRALSASEIALLYKQQLYSIPI